MHIGNVGWLQLKYRTDTFSSKLELEPALRGVFSMQRFDYKLKVTSFPRVFFFFTFFPCLFLIQSKYNFCFLFARKYHWFSLTHWFERSMQNVALAPSSFANTLVCHQHVSLHISLFQHMLSHWRSVVHITPIQWKKVIRMVLFIDLDSNQKETFVQKIP